MPDPQPPTGGIDPNSYSTSSGRAGRFTAAFQNLLRLGSSIDSKRCVALAATVLLLGISINAFVGCSSGAEAFDGGHIPVGGRFASVISGIAFDAESDTTPVPGAKVIVTNTSVTGVQSTQTTTTTANGSFAFNGFPDVSGTNNYQISVTPPTGSNRLAQQIAFPVTGGQSATVLVAMPEITFDEFLATAVTILQQGYTLHSGDTIDVGAELLDAQGSPLGVLPTLIFTGNFGKISPGGLFTSTTTGTGTVSGYWYTGFSQLQSSTATITADTSTSFQPPPPPITGPVTVPGK